VASEGEAEALVAGSDFLTSAEIEMALFVG
jgi:hypothetical protein